MIYWFQHQFSLTSKSFTPTLIPTTKTFKTLKDNDAQVFVKGILAAPSITSNALKMLTDWGLSFKKIILSFYLKNDSEKQLRIKEFLL